jgi:hypothetical protein
LLKIKPQNFSLKLFITHLAETFRLTALAKLFILDENLNEFINKIEQSLNIEFSEKDAIIAIQDLLANKIYNIGIVENYSPFSKIIYLILQELSETEINYKNFAQNIHFAKLLCIDIQQKELELFCDLLIAYSYSKLDNINKASSICDNIIEFSQKHSLLNIYYLSLFIKAKVLNNNEFIEFDNELNQILKNENVLDKLLP